VLDRTRDRGHGRIELRTVKAVTVHHFGFPHTARVLQVTRKTRDLRDGNIRRWRIVVVYAITSLAFARPARPGLPTSSADTGRWRTACSTCGM
jgi:hypothetical protein